MKTFLLILILTLLSACSFLPYSVAINENVIYSPNPNSEQEAGIMADSNLQGCLNRLLKNSNISTPEEVTLLACPDAGIKSLIGINNLKNLEQLELSNNGLTDLNPLLSLKKLRVLSVRQNQLGNISSLNSLPILRFISLQGNPNISCRQLDRLGDKLGSTLNRPLSCK